MAETRSVRPDVQRRRSATSAPDRHEVSISHSAGVSAAAGPSPARSKFFDAVLGMAEAAWLGDVKRWNEIRCSTVDRLATGFIASQMLAQMILARAHLSGVAAADAWQWIRAGEILD